VKGRYTRFAAKPLLKDTAATDFLQGISLLHTYELHTQDINTGLTGKAVTGVSAKREHILAMPRSAYERWADPLVKGFLEAEQFLRHLGFHHPKFLPYRAQIIPLAATLALIGDRWLEPQIQMKLSRWYWCGVFGELYGSASETRIALDLQGLMCWINGSSDLEQPSTVTAAGFQPSRLDTLRSRTSAAYRGLYVLLQKQGAEDFFWKAKMVELDRNEKGIDIHHIFPRKWCEEQKIPIGPAIFNSIVNKTAISYRANRKIGGKAPSVYLAQLEEDKAVQLTSAQMDSILRTHCISPTLMRNDDFHGFMQDRKGALLSLIEAAMGKEAVETGELASEDDHELDDEEVEV
jgi:hypothetical protein